MSELEAFKIVTISFLIFSFCIFSHNVFIKIKNNIKSLNGKN